MMGSFAHFEVVQTTGGQEQHERYVGDETPHIMFHVNWLPRGAGVNLLTDDDGVLSGQPVRTADIGGFPTYGDLLVITTNGRPIWTPVSRENFMMMSGGQTAKVNPDGTFSFRNIAPAEYHLNVRMPATADRSAEAANVIVSVTGGDVGGVNVVTSVAGSVTGRVTGRRGSISRGCSPSRPSGPATTSPLPSRPSRTISGTIRTTSSLCARKRSGSRFRTATPNRSSSS